jgi:hypothetical protein
VIGPAPEDGVTTSLNQCTAPVTARTRASAQDALIATDRTSLILHFLPRQALRRRRARAVLPWVWALCRKIRCTTFMR